MLANAVRITYTVYSNAGILVAYIIIYFVIRKLYYGSKLAVNKASRRNLQSLLIMFVSICAIYIIRIIRDVRIVLDIYDRDIYEVSIAKTILTLGILISLYNRLKVAVERKNESGGGATNSQLLDST